MSVNRREFIRRVVAASILVATGVVGFFELVERQNNAQPPQNIITLPQSTSTTQATTSAQETTTAQTSSTSQTSQSATKSTSRSTTQSTTQAVPPGYILVAPMSALSGKSSAYFNHPSGGLSLLLNFNAEWKAYSATCTHAPCTVEYLNSQIYCPCHAGTFDPANGNVTGGPPPTRLPEYGVLIQNNNLYVTSKIIS